MATFALATSQDLRDLTAGDRQLQRALRDRGHGAWPWVWTEPAPTAVTHLVVRSSWDYHLRPRDFFRWLERCDADGVALANPLSLLRWNASKLYLRELGDGGIPVPATLWLHAGDRIDEASLPPGEVVLKPWVSASAHRTHRARWPFDSAARERLEAELRESPMLVQQFLPAIEREGEVSFVFFGGNFHHAVRKLAAAGDFRVQVEHGGRVEPFDPPPDAVMRAREVLEALPERPVYARVDAVIDGDAWWLVEVELIEPELFLETKEGAADALADALLEHFALT